MDQGNLFGLKGGINSLLADICLFRNVANENGYQLFNSEEIYSRFVVLKLTKAVLIPDDALFWLQMHDYHL